MPNIVRLATACAAILASPACLGPQVSDEIAPGRVLPPGSEVPSIYDDPELAAQIDANDNVGAVVPRLTGFSALQVVRFWDFGPAPAAAAPVFLLVNRTDDGTIDRIDHPPILDALPGDVGYSPLWVVFTVPVTPEYDGELIPSVAAIEEAQLLGLVEAPQQADVFINCPVVADGVVLDRGDGTTTAPAVAFARGGQVGCFDFSALFGVLHPLAADGATVPQAFALGLRAEGREPLSEPVRRVDITGDGDIVDTNDIFDAPLDPALYTPLSRVVNVVVVSNLATIDSLNDDSNSGARATADLFTVAEGELIPGAAVVAFEVTDELRDLALDLGEIVVTQ